MYLVLVHLALHVGDLRLGSYRLRSSRHDVADGMVEELCLPALHSTTNVAVGDQSNDLAVLQSHTQSEFALAHVDDSLAEVHFLRDDRQVVAPHHVLRGGEESLTQFTTRMELCKVLGLEVADLHQCDGKRVAHDEGSGRGADD